jgi:calcineurin-like phosphoesterase family protein
MDAILIKNFNEVVKPEDTTVHIGDFTMRGQAIAEKYFERLNGTHIFIKGSHDYWIKESAIHIWEQEINGIYVVACHYAMRTWPRSHHGSIQLYGHSHGKLKGETNQMDVGVDANKFYPISFIQVIERLNLKESNEDHKRKWAIRQRSGEVQR